MTVAVEHGDGVARLQAQDAQSVCGGSGGQGAFLARAQRGVHEQSDLAHGNFARPSWSKV
jgi:hypothetical protein